MWETVDDDVAKDAQVPVAWECVGDDDDDDDNPAGGAKQPDEARDVIEIELGTHTRRVTESRQSKESSRYSKRGRQARELLQALSIKELRGRLAAFGETTFDVATTHCSRDDLAELLLAAQGVDSVLAHMHGSDGAVAADMEFPDPEDPSYSGGGVRQESLRAALGAPQRSGLSFDYSKFEKIGDGDLDDDDAASLADGGWPDFSGTPLEGLDPLRVLRGDLSEDERREAFLKAIKDLEKKGGLKPPPPPVPECNPMPSCAPNSSLDDFPRSGRECGSTWSGPCPEAEDPYCFLDVEYTPHDRVSETGEPSYVEHGESTSKERTSAQPDPADEEEVWETLVDEDAAASNASECGSLEFIRRDTALHRQGEDEGDGPIFETICGETGERPSADGLSEYSKRCVQVGERYNHERKKFDDETRVLEAVDIDGWNLERSQFDLVEEADEDMIELKVLLQCCERADNQERLRKAIREFEIRLRVKKTWAWFPLTRWVWSGFEFEKPVITIDFKVPAAGALPPEDLHCEFGADWFDLKVWNVSWPDDPGVMYHHRVKKTRLMRDIVPAESSVKAVGDHIYVYLQKVYEPRHGYCAWPELAAGKGRKPFKYNEDAPDGGLMDFFESEYEKHEGYDGFRRDIGKAMEKIHRGEPVRGIPDTPMEED